MTAYFKLIKTLCSMPMYLWSHNRDSVGTTCYSAPCPCSLYLLFPSRDFAYQPPPPTHTINIEKLGIGLETRLLTIIICFENLNAIAYQRMEQKYYELTEYTKRDNDGLRISSEEISYCSHLSLMFSQNYARPKCK